MALKEEIQTIVSTLLPQPVFFYGTEDEFNTGVDDIDLTNGVFFMYSLQQVGFKTTNNNSVDNDYSIFIAFLYKVDFDGINSSQAEPFDKQAVSMLNQFIVKLQNFRDENGVKVFKINVGQKSQPKPCYFNYTDTNLYGRSFALDLNTFINEKICY